ncbi:DnaA N-terminal domain-containing protein [Oceanobacillus sp. FSL K6-3682]|uniref:DnaA N-terminal domain-containing protein n=1 Tax=Oceanobacillus sp. FSL K6-3682 TaxID=2921503 RepID=UPI0030D8A269
MGIWQKVLEKISYQISKPSFDTWFKKTTAEFVEDALTVYSSSEFTIDWLKEKYSTLVAESVKEVTGEDYSIHFEVTEENEKLASIFPNAYFESSPNDTDSISRLERKIDRLEQKIQQLIDVKRLDERAEQLEERISKLEEQVK